jgi:hypothetical protein
LKLPICNFYVVISIDHRLSLVLDRRYLWLHHLCLRQGRARNIG